MSCLQRGLTLLVQYTGPGVLRVDTRARASAARSSRSLPARVRTCGLSRSWTCAERAVMPATAADSSVATT
eukprot:674971-Rhodomonas_salina.1